MRRRAFLILAALLLQATTGVHATSGRAIGIELITSNQGWLSNQTAEIQADLSNLPYGVVLIAEWTLQDESSEIVFQMNDTFQATGTVTTLILEAKHFYNNDTFYNVTLVVLDSSNNSLIQGTQAFAVFQNSIMPTIGNFLAFGDSLSDMGNAKNSIVNVPDVPPYWQGRFSNGEIWIEYVSDSFGVQTTIGSGTSAGDNRAFGGSQTGSGYSYVLLPNVGTQISNYFANVQSSIPSNDIISLWSGGNDFLYGTANADTIAANMETHIRQLANAGATEFIIPNLPPLEKTPEVLSRSQSQQNAIGQEVVRYNQKLSGLLVNLSAELGITVHSIDAWTIFNDILQNKEALGLTNTADAACSGGISLLPLPICSSGDTVAPNVDEYLFFDKAHPTRVMHHFIGRFAVEAIGMADTDGDGVEDEFDQCDWTEDRSTSDMVGCDWAQRDDDADGVANGKDACQDTVLNSTVDENGCSAVQRDSDNDGLNDAVDPCPFSEGQFDHDNDGCTDEVDLDDDNDGVYDVDDECPTGFLGVHDQDLDMDGCHDDEDSDIDGDGLTNEQEEQAGTDERDTDSDDDSVNDGSDAFPTDPSEWNDADADGCGDNKDAFPFNAEECFDSDGDGVGDNEDLFPTDDSEWADQDGDGVGDNSDECFLVFGTSLVPLGCPDFDGDGYADAVDAFPTDPFEWNDSDGDGFGDNSDAFPNDSFDWSDMDNDSYGDNRDAFPFDASEWNDTDLDTVGDNQDAFPTDPTEWMDSDADGCGDNADVWPLDPLECGDRDFDGVGDNIDAFPDSALEWLDSDGDGLGDNSDLFPNDSSAKYDSDQDGIANAHDPFPNNANLDSWFDIITRIGGVLFLVLGVAAYFFRYRQSEGQIKWDESETLVDKQGEEGHMLQTHRPTSSPPLDAFSQPPQQ